MRIIAGEFRGRILKSPANAKTRPTSDRLRESIFNILAPRIDEDTRFLDLCAGTGAVGIEAISRGAGFCVFVDISRKSCGLIETNLDLLQIPEQQTVVIMSDAAEFLPRSKYSFDIVYFDPPYSSDYLNVLKFCGEKDQTLLAEDAILLVEHHSKTDLPDLIGELRRWRILKQGESQISFYQQS